MSSLLTTILNWKSKLNDEDVFVGNGIKEAVLYQKGDYNISLFELAPNHSPHMHYHTFGVHDFVFVLQGSGRLHLAQIKNSQIVEGSNEVIHIHAGDFYDFKPYVLHGLETLEETLVIANFAPVNHNNTIAEGENPIGLDFFYPKK
ncbi:hypothetical protein SOPP22_09415 [Shewanella sp. OPT22]|nr:hypothetical protein SOPP22_09415 [Shewanella sp. OPT22]